MSPAALHHGGHGERHRARRRLRLRASGRSGQTHARGRAVGGATLQERTGTRGAGADHGGERPTRPQSCLEGCAAPSSVAEVTPAIWRNRGQPSCWTLAVPGTVFRARRAILHGAASTLWVQVRLNFTHTCSNSGIAWPAYPRRTRPPDAHLSKDGSRSKPRATLREPQVLLISPGSPRDARFCQATLSALWRPCTPRCGETFSHGPSTRQGTKR